MKNVLATLVRPHDDVDRARQHHHEPQLAASKLVLRVVAGVHEGAEVALDGRELVVLGQSDDCDILLKDEGVAARHLAISLRPDGIAVRALDGDIGFCQQTLKSGAALALPKYVPLLLGKAAIALGAPEDSRWHDLDPLLLRAAADGEKGASDTAALQSESVAEPAVDEAAPPDPARHPRTKHAPFGWLRHAKPARKLALRVSAVSCLILLGVGGLSTWQAKRSTGLSQVDANTEQQTAVAQSPGDAPAPQANALPPGKVSGAEGENMVQQVREVFRVNGLNANVRYEGNGTVMVEGLPKPDTHIDAAVSHALNDVKGLTSVRVQPAEEGKAAAAPAAAPAPPVPAAAAQPAADEETNSAEADANTAADAKKRIQAVVDDSPAYVLTADGARYFVGALLPQGYRILRIRGASVTLKKEGEKETVMNF
jgi:type III secretion protein D